MTPDPIETPPETRGLLSRAWHGMWNAIRLYFLAGLLAFAPIGITIWAIAWIVRQLDNLLLPRFVDWLLPGMDRPVELPPFVGALFTFFVILLSGVIVRHFFGGELIRGWERLLQRVPFARSIYAGVKQLFEAIFSSSRTTSFNTVVLVEYPRKGLWALAFTTGTSGGPLQDAFPEQTMLNCFVPTTPNPTSGFYLLVPEDEIREVDLSIEDAFKVVMSAGLVTPEAIDRRAGRARP